MLSVTHKLFMLSVIMPNVIMLSIFMLNVVVPYQRLLGAYNGAFTLAQFRGQFCTKLACLEMKK